MKKIRVENETGAEDNQVNIPVEEVFLKSIFLRLYLKISIF